MQSTCHFGRVFDFTLSDSWFLFLLICYVKIIIVTYHNSPVCAVTVAQWYSVQKCVALDELSYLCNRLLQNPMTNLSGRTDSQKFSQSDDDSVSGNLATSRPLQH